MNVKLDGLTLHVEPDYNPPHPRTECDHFGKMLCWHRNYTFGDQNRYDTPEDFYRSEEAKNIYVSLPVYMLDHSGTFLSTEAFPTSIPAVGVGGRSVLSTARKKMRKNGSGICPIRKC